SPVVMSVLSARLQLCCEACGLPDRALAPAVRTHYASVIERCPQAPAGGWCHPALLYRLLILRHVCFVLGHATSGRSNAPTLVGSTAAGASALTVVAYQRPPDRGIRAAGPVSKLSGYVRNVVAVRLCAAFCVDSLMCCMELVRVTPTERH